ncbi:hypothetical protein [Sunxiuqinia indica]|uniref:hypothetical protein n=1 Tax=Sunxiuqinia indica TaxID=2692584 RepID=UPI0013584694|nr:hypothetical protein [Sunxiuqinia indica]
MKIVNLALLIIVSCYFSFLFPACTKDKSPENTEEKTEKPSEDITSAIKDTIAITPVFEDGKTFGFSDIHADETNFNIYGVPQFTTGVVNFAQAQEDEEVVAIANIKMEITSPPLPKFSNGEVINTKTTIEIEAMPDTVLFYACYSELPDVTKSNEDMDVNVAVNKIYLEEGDYQNLHFEVDSIWANFNRDLSDRLFHQFIKRGLKRFFAGNIDHITIYNNSGETRITSNPDDININTDKKVVIDAEFKITKINASMGAYIGHKFFKLSDGKCLRPKLETEYQ